MESNIACFHVNFITPQANCKHAKKNIIKSVMKINTSMSPLNHYILLLNIG